MNTPHPIYFCKQEDGTFLAASIDSPRFCVAGPTEQEAKDKAQRALNYYRSTRGKPRNVAPRETLVISLAFEETELCA